METGIKCVISSCMVCLPRLLFIFETTQSTTQICLTYFVLISRMIPECVSYLCVIITGRRVVEYWLALPSRQDAQFIHSNHVFLIPRKLLKYRNKLRHGLLWFFLIHYALVISSSTLIDLLSCAEHHCKSMILWWSYCSKWYRHASWLYTTCRAVAREYPQYSLWYVCSSTLQAPSPVSAHAKLSHRASSWTVH